MVVVFVQEKERELQESFLSGLMMILVPLYFTLKMR